MVNALWTIDDIRREILKLEESSTYQKADFYRSFAKKLQLLFGDFQVVKGDDELRDVEIIYANPERAVAKIWEGKTTNLPLLSLQFDGIELAPVASKLVFAINIWGKYIEEVNQLTEQILLKFRPNFPIELNPEETYQSYVRDISEASDFTPADRQDRVIKRIVRFEVDSYIPSKVYKFTNTCELLVMNYETYDEETSGLIPLESWYAGGGMEFALGQVNRGAGLTTIPGS